MNRFLIIASLYICSCNTPPTTIVTEKADSSSVSTTLPRLEGGSEHLFRHRWYFTEAKGQAIVPSLDTAQLLFYPGHLSTVRGSTGCNKLNGSFVLGDSNAIQFSPIATTRRMCANGGSAIEKAILASLSEAKFYSINDVTLKLFNDSIVVAVLRAALPGQDEGSSFQTDNAATDTEFKGGGNEPFWSLEVNKKTGIHFRLIGGDSVHSAYVNPVRLENATGSCYKVQTADGIFNAFVYDRLCINDMSGDSLPQAVEISWKNLKLKGCGRYTADGRLNGGWVLQSINDSVITGTTLLKGSPRLNFRLNEGRVYGHGGCNSITARLDVKGSQMRISRPVGTKMACNDKGFEARYITLISDRDLSYALRDGFLIISSGNSRLRYKQAD